MRKYGNLFKESFKTLFATEANCSVIKNQICLPNILILLVYEQSEIFGVLKKSVKMILDK